MKKLALLLLILFLLVPGLSLSAREAFDITSYHVEIRIGNDNAYHIREFMTVDFYKSMHGIKRALPTLTYNGNRVRITDVAANVPFKTYRESDDEIIRLGDSKHDVSGQVNYEISYTYDIGEDGLRNMDEVYFNLIGTGWDCQIANVSFSVTMPKPFDASRLNFTWGKQGSKAKAPLDLKVSGTRITGTLQDSLGPGEGLTMALPLPQGYYDAPNMYNGISSYAKFMPFVLGGLLVAAFLIRLLIRSLNRSVEAVTFTPEDLNPVDMTYILNDYAGTNASRALLLDWGRRGYLRLDRVNPTTPEELSEFASLNTKAARVLKDPCLKVTLLREADDRMKPYEASLYREFCKHAGMKGYFFMEAIPKDLRARISELPDNVAKYWDEPERKIFRVHGFWAGLPGFLPALAAIVLARYFFSNDDLTMLTFLKQLLISILICVFLVHPIGEMLNNYVTDPAWRKASTIASAIGFILVGSALILFVFSKTPVQFMPFSLISYLAAILIDALAGQMNFYTDFGKKRRAEVSAYRNYLITAGVGRETDNPFETDSATYFEHLPFIYAFDLFSVWNTIFKPLDVVEEPSWIHVGGGTNRIYRNDFSMAFNSQLNSLNRGFSSGSGSSGGSSGGGSSGGGSGGGGGGGW